MISVASRLSLRERRLIGVAIVSLIGVAIPTRVYPAWDRWTTDRRQATQELESEVRRAASRVSALAEMQDSLEARRTRFLALAPAILSGRSPQAGGMALVEFLTSAAQQADVRAGPMQLSVDSTSAGLFVPVRVEMSVTGDVTGIAALLDRIERGPFLLIVTRLSLSQPEPAAPSEQPEALQIQLVVEGLTFPRPEATDEP